jgi:hypothetical protein
MKKVSPSAPSEAEQDELLPEYRFDYRNAKPNRFASEPAKNGLTVVLDEDVAEVFTTPQAVNKALRALIEVVPLTKRLKKH